MCSKTPFGLSQDYIFGREAQEIIDKYFVGTVA